MSFFGTSNPTQPLAVTLLGGTSSAEVLVQVVECVARMCVSCAGLFGDICKYTTNALLRQSGCEGISIGMVDLELRRGCRVP